MPVCARRRKFPRFLGDLPGATKAAKELGKRGILAGLKQTGWNVATEIPEELVTELSQAVNDRYSQVDAEALEPDRLVDMVAQTVAQTVLSVGMASSPGLVARAGESIADDRARWNARRAERQADESWRRLEDDIEAELAADEAAGPLLDDGGAVPADLSGATEAGPGDNTTIGAQRPVGRDAVGPRGQLAIAGLEDAAAAQEQADVNIRALEEAGVRLDEVDIDAVRSLVPDPEADLDAVFDRVAHEDIENFEGLRSALQRIMRPVAAQEGDDGADVTLESREPGNVPQGPARAAERGVEDDFAMREGEFLPVRHIADWVKESLGVPNLVANFEFIFNKRRERKDESFNSPIEVQFFTEEVMSDPDLLIHDRPEQDSYIAVKKVGKYGLVAVDVGAGKVRSAYRMDSDRKLGEKIKRAEKEGGQILVPGASGPSIVPSSTTLLSSAIQILRQRGHDVKGLERYAAGQQEAGPGAAREVYDSTGATQSEATRSRSGPAGPIDSVARDGEIGQGTGQQPTATTQQEGRALEAGTPFARVPEQQDQGGDVGQATDPGPQEFQSRETPAERSGVPEIPGREAALDESPGGWRRRSAAWNRGTKIFGRLRGHFSRSSEQTAAIGHVVDVGDQLNPENTENRGLAYREVDDIEASAVQENFGVDIAGYRHVIYSTEVRHTQKKHGNPATEEPRGQVAVQREDYLLIPEVTRPENLVETDTNERGQTLLRYEKRVNGHMVVVEEVRTGRRQLAFVSMWKRKSKERTTDEAMTTEAPASKRPGTTGSNPSLLGGRGGATGVPLDRSPGDSTSETTSTRPLPSGNVPQGGRVVNPQAANIPDNLETGTPFPQVPETEQDAQQPGRGGEDLPGEFRSTSTAAPPIPGRPMPGRQDVGTTGRQGEGVAARARRAIRASYHSEECRRSRQSNTG